MRATFTDHQLDIARTVRSLAMGGLGQARAALDGGWVAPASEDALLRDFSLLGVPESAGGIGSSLIDLVVAVEALGEQVSPSRFTTHAAAIQLAVSTGVLSADVLEGRTVLTAAIDAPGLPGWADLPGAHPLRRTLVPHVATIDAVVGLGADGVWIGDPGEVAPRQSFDPSLPLGDLTLTTVERPAPVGAGPQRATLVRAAELCGIAQGAIDLAAGHARTREQFGRVIGSFQAVAFQLAEAATLRKAAWDLTLYAAWAVEQDRPQAPIQVHAAKAAAGRAALFAAERCIQVHGGMGITMEADPHLFLRRAFVLDAVSGRGSWHRRRAGELRVADRRAIPV